MSAAIYPTTLIQGSNEFVFTTATGHVYSVYFDTRTGSHPDEDIDRHSIYMGFTCTPKLLPFERHHDPKIGATIMWIVANMFKEHKHAIISYVCSPELGRARARLIIFKKWYSESPLKEKISHIPKRIDDDNCFGVMFSKKHPHLEKIEFYFEDFDPKDKFGRSLVEEDAAYYDLEEEDLDEL